jgi:hypothetical protein
MDKEVNMMENPSPHENVMYGKLCLEEKLCSHFKVGLQDKACSRWKYR